MAVGRDFKVLVITLLLTLELLSFCANVSMLSVSCIGP